MVGSKAAWLATAVTLCAAPSFAQDACDGCAPRPQSDWSADSGRAIGADRRVVYEQSHADRASYDERYVERSRTVTRVAYSDGYLTWAGKDAGGGYVDGDAYDQGPRGRMPDCPPVKPGEHVISCRYVPLRRPAPPQEADIAPAGGVLYAEGGVGPDYIAGGGGGGGTTIIEGGSSSSFASASASASVNASIIIKEREGGHQPPHKGGGGSWGGGGGSMGGGSWGGGSGGGSWGGGGSMSGGIWFLGVWFHGRTRRRLWRGELGWRLDGRRRRRRLLVRRRPWRPSGQPWRLARSRSEIVRGEACGCAGPGSPATRRRNFPIS